MDRRKEGCQNEESVKDFLGGWGEKSFTEKLQKFEPG
jgi:hypothetical protein